MAHKDALTKILATVGTLLAWFPIAAPLVLCIVVLIRAGQFRLDYLMPAELSWAAAVGGALLVWASARARSRRKLIGWSLGGALLFLVGSQALAVATGLATGRTEPNGWQMAVVLGALVLYIVAVVATAVGGVLLLRDLFRNGPAAQTA